MYPEIVGTIGVVILIMYLIFVFAVRDAEEANDYDNDEFFAFHEDDEVEIDDHYYSR